VKLGVADWPSPSGVRKINGDETALEIVVGHARRTHFPAAGHGASRSSNREHTGRPRPRKWVVAPSCAEGSAGVKLRNLTRDLHGGRDNFGRGNSYCSYIIRVKDASKVNDAVTALKNLKIERNFQTYTERGILRQDSGRRIVRSASPSMWSR